jgi:hypothetical protein
VRTSLSQAAKYIPIIASVSEHQPPTWSSYFMDIQLMQMLLPAGVYACFRGDPTGRHPVGGRPEAASVAGWGGGTHQG